MARPLTQETQPSQTELRWVREIPEGIEYAPAGAVVIVQRTGDWYRKTTPVEYNIGWALFTTGGTAGGNIIRDTDPFGTAADGTLWINRLTSNQWFYDAVAGSWTPMVVG